MAVTRPVCLNLTLLLCQYEAAAAASAVTRLYCSTAVLHVQAARFVINELTLSGPVIGQLISNLHSHWFLDWIDLGNQAIGQ